MKLIPPWAWLAIAALLLASALAAGWKISAWRSGSADAAAANARVETLVTELQQQREDLADRIKELDQFNDETAKAQLAALDDIRKAQAALKGVRDEISRIDVGVASISADADRLRDEAYRAATGAAGHKAPAPNRGNGAAGSAPAAKPGGGSGAR